MQGGQGLNQSSFTEAGGSGKFIPITGTEPSKPVTGDVVFTNDAKIGIGAEPQFAIQIIGEAPNRRESNISGVSNIISSIAYGNGGAGSASFVALREGDIKGSNAGLYSNIGQYLFAARFDDTIYTAGGLGAIQDGWDIDSAPSRLQMFVTPVLGTEPVIRQEWLENGEIVFNKYNGVGNKLAFFDENGKFVRSAIDISSLGGGYKSPATSSSTTIDPTVLGTTVTFTVDSDMSYGKGNRVRASKSVDNTIYIGGVVQSYSGTTLTVLIDTYMGAGAVTAWLINLGSDIPQQIVSAVPNLYIDATNGIDALDAGTILRPYLTVDYALSRIKATGVFTGYGALTNKTVIVLNGIATTNQNIHVRTINWRIESAAKVTYTGTDYLFKDTGGVNNTLIISGNGILESNGDNGIISFTGSTAAFKNQVVLRDISIVGLNASRTKPLVNIAGNQQGGFNFNAYNCRFGSTNSGSNIHGLIYYASGDASTNISQCNFSAINIFKSVVYIAPSANISLPSRTLFSGNNFGGSANGFDPISLVCIAGNQRSVLFKDCFFASDRTNTVNIGLWILKAVDVDYTDFTMDGCVFTDEFADYSIACTTDEAYTARTTNVNIRLGFNKRAKAVLGVITPDPIFVTV